MEVQAHYHSGIQDALVCISTSSARRCLLRLLHVPRYVQCAQRHGWRWSARLFRKQQGQHRFVLDVRRSWILRRNLHQQAWYPYCFIFRRCWLLSLRGVIPVLQSHQESWFHHFCWCASWSMRRYALVCSGSHHDVLPTGRVQGSLHLLVLDDLQPGCCDW